MGPTGYGIILLYFLALLFIGYYHARKQQSVADYFLGGRAIPAWAALASVVATETSAITFIGTPALSFRKGGDLAFLQVVMGYVIARVILSFYFLPKFFEKEIVTIYEYLGNRFGKRAQRTAGIFFFITRALASGVRHYAAALVISSFTQIDLITSILLTGGICLVYSWMGGISAVIWTEVFQVGIMIAGSILAFVYLIHSIPGGWPQAWAIAQAHNKLTLFHSDWSGQGSYALLSGILGGICISLASHGADQDLVQRLLACRSLRGAQTAMIGSGIYIFFQFAFFLAIGILLFAYYGTLPSGVEKEDGLLLHFVAHNMPPAAAALVIAAILSAALSSMASAINALASTSVSDFVPATIKQSLSNRALIRISRAFTGLWTLALIAIAIWARKSEYILDTGLSIPGFTFGSLLAAFLLGIFTPLRKQVPLIIGMIAGVGVVSILAWRGIHWTWFYPAGTASTILLALVLNRFNYFKNEEN